MWCQGQDNVSAEVVGVVHDVTFRTLKVLWTSMASTVWVIGFRFLFTFSCQTSIHDPTSAFGSEIQERFDVLPV